jgi:hypothetical protein
MHSATYHSGLGSDDDGKVIGALAECDSVRVLDARESLGPCNLQSRRTNHDHEVIRTLQTVDHIYNE